MIKKYNAIFIYIKYKKLDLKVKKSMYKYLFFYYNYIDEITKNVT